MIHLLCALLHVKLFPDYLRSLVSQKPGHLSAGKRHAPPPPLLIGQLY